LIAEEDLPIIWDILERKLEANQKILLLGRGMVMGQLTSLKFRPRAKKKPLGLVCWSASNQEHITQNLEVWNLETMGLSKNGDSWDLELNKNLPRDKRANEADRAAY
jgi:hypothetical protein